MKVVLRCSNLKYEDILKIEYSDDKIKLHTIEKVFEYSVTPKLGTYVAITDTGLEYFQYEGTPWQEHQTERKSMREE